jgi:NodT family efflux transporter outer membrane factor (OMF) lipoprotein
VRTPITSCLLATSLAACTVGPNFKPPAPPAPTAWQRLAPQDTAVSPATDPDPHWWTQFADPTLNRLIMLAIAGNPDLKESVLRVVEARQSVTTARAAGLPTLNGTASYMREQLGVKGILESDGVYSQLNSLADASSPLNQYSPGLGTQVSKTAEGALNSITQPINLFQYGLDASWELDLFGRVRRSVEQARASAQAQAEAANDALIMLESEVAQTYIQLRGAQALTQAQQQNIDADQDALNLTARSARVGLTTELDVDQARTQLDNDTRQMPQYEKQALQAIDQLNVLTGQPPGTLDAMLIQAQPLPDPPAVIGIGVPSTLARRRPDIRQAEAQLHAATASVGVAVANFYPDISLTGNLGIRATDASYLTNWASHFYSAGPSVSLPIFQGGRLTAGLRMARAQQAEAALNYRGTVLNALREVEDELVAYRTDRAARDSTAATLAAAEDTLHLSRSRYANGLSDFLQVLDSERSAVSARQELVQANLSLVDDVIALYRALGGGWQNTAPGIASATVPAQPPPLPAALDSLAAP